MLRVFALLILCFLPVAAVTQTAPAIEEDVVLGLSQNRVRITANFDGSEILFFGAVTRNAPLPDSELDVIIAIAGPSEPLVVRKKERRFGIWVNTESADVQAAPSFYSVSTTRPLGDILTENTDVQHRITAAKAVWALKSEAAFSEAVLRIRANNGLYQLNEGAIEVDKQTLFQTRVHMPSNLTEGPYIARVYLLRDQRVVSSHQTVIDVRKVGLERFLFNLSRQQPLVYGLLSIAIAIFAGWGAAAVFRLFNRG
ncbi:MULTISPECIES: TIGR02186 family protein [unclassified Marinovum]